MSGGETLDDGAPELGVEPTLVRFADDEPPPRELGSLIGARIGRYVVLERLGAGGMGVVYAAWDPQLDRKLALKLLDGRRRDDDSQGRDRMLREAQAMARLEHPNVVAVHDVGTHGERLFIAMEFVDGQTVRAWLDGERPWREVLAVFLAAGQGLAAAHAAGLVHRDFKPDNVMVGSDGRVRVLDFGLARRGDLVDSAAPSASADTSRLAALSKDDTLGSLTRTGVLIGTPAYMSPEQFAGAALDARSDQFSFCVALWEALAGQRPFAGRNRVELIDAVCEGKRRTWPRPELPAALVSALTRGLEPRPDARWPDMVSLLAALEAGAQPRRRWLIPAALGSALLVGLVAVPLALGEDEPAPAPAPIVCEVAPERFADVWDEAAAARLERAFLATGRPWAAESAARVRVALDTWTERWRAMAEGTCEAHHLRHELSAELFDLRMACLDQRLRALDSLVELLTPSSPDPALIDQAIDAAAGLEGVESCRDPVRLRAEAIADPALARQVADLRAALERREQLQDLLQFEQGLAAGEALRPQLEVVAQPALWARYWRLRALDQLNLGEPEAALQSAITGVTEAWRSGLAVEQLHAVLVLTRVTLYAGNPGESERWLLLGERIGAEVDDRWSRYELPKARGFLAVHEGDSAAAIAPFEAAMKVARAEYGERSIEHATELVNYGRALVDADPTDPDACARGIELQREGVARAGEAYGPNHPYTLGIRVSEIVSMHTCGQVEEAQAEYRKLAEAVAGNSLADHPMLKNLPVLGAKLGLGEPAEGDSG